MGSSYSTPLRAAVSSHAYTHAHIRKHAHTHPYSLPRSLSLLYAGIQGVLMFRISVAAVVHIPQVKCAKGDGSPIKVEQCSEIPGKTVGVGKTEWAGLPLCVPKGAG